MANVKLWLNSLELGQYADVLLNNEFNSFAALRQLEDNDLSDMNISKVGARRKLMNGVRELRRRHAAEERTKIPKLHPAAAAAYTSMSAATYTEGYSTIMNSQQPTADSILPPTTNPPAAAPPSPTTQDEPFEGPPPLQPLNSPTPHSPPTEIAAPHHHIHNQSLASSQQVVSLPNVRDSAGSLPKVQPREYDGQGIPTMQFANSNNKGVAHKYQHSNHQLSRNAITEEDEEAGTTTSSDAMPDTLSPHLSSAQTSSAGSDYVSVVVQKPKRRRATSVEVLDSLILKQLEQEHNTKLLIDEQQASPKYTLAPIDTALLAEKEVQDRYDQLSPVSRVVQRSVDAYANRQHKNAVMRHIIEENDQLLEIINLYENEDKKLFASEEGDTQIHIPDSLKQRAMGVASIHRHSNQIMSNPSLATSPTTTASTEPASPITSPPFVNKRAPPLRSGLITTAAAMPHGHISGDLEVPQLVPIDDTVVKQEDIEQHEQQQREREETGSHTSTTLSNSNQRNNNSNNNMDNSNDYGVPNISSSTLMESSTQTPNYANNNKVLKKRRKKRDHMWRMHETMKQSDADESKAPESEHEQADENSPKVKPLILPVTRELEHYRQQQREQEAKLAEEALHPPELRMIFDDEVPPPLSPVTTATMYLMKANNVMVHKANMAKILDNENNQLENIVADFADLLEERRSQQLGDEPILFSGSGLGTAQKSFGADASLTHFAHSIAAKQQAENLMDEDKPVSAILAAMPFLKPEDKPTRSVLPTSSYGAMAKTLGSRGLAPQGVGKGRKPTRLQGRIMVPSY